MSSEAAIQQQILLELGARNDVRLWRNETATGWVGKLVRQDDGLATLANARRLHAGLCNGSADLIGIASPSGRLVAIEVKAPGGKTTREQQTFLDTVRDMGGIAGVVTSPEEAKALVDSVGGE